MRDGNFSKNIKQFFQRQVFELPMRDGNSHKRCKNGRSGSVFELPMRDGNLRKLRNDNILT